MLTKVYAEVATCAIGSEAWKNHKRTHGACYLRGVRAKIQIRNLLGSCCTKPGNDTCGDGECCAMDDAPAE